MNTNHDDREFDEISGMGWVQYKVSKQEGEAEERTKRKDVQNIQNKERRDMLHKTADGHSSVK